MRKTAKTALLLFLTGLLALTGLAAAAKAEPLKRLAKYKAPSHFVVYDEFPMLGSGKIDGVPLKADALRRIKED